MNQEDVDTFVGAIIGAIFLFFLFTSLADPEYQRTTSCQLVCSQVCRVSSTEFIQNLLSNHT